MNAWVALCFVVTVSCFNGFSYTCQSSGLD